MLDIGATPKLPQYRLHALRRGPGQISIGSNPGSVEPIPGRDADPANGGQIVGRALARAIADRGIS